MQQANPLLIEKKKKIAKKPIGNYIMIIIIIYDDVSCCTYGCALCHTLYLVAHCRKCGKTLVWPLLLLALSIIVLRFA